MRAAALTAEQTEAVESGDGAQLITAPPGSGKTEVLVQRVIHLLDQSPGDLFRILALTYTVKAARELKDRVRQVVPDRDRWRVNAITFHSFGLGILQNYGKPVGLNPHNSHLRYRGQASSRYAASHRPRGSARSTPFG